jgi:hypothetical protein
MTRYVVVGGRTGGEVVWTAGGHDSWLAEEDIGGCVEGAATALKSLYIWDLRELAKDSRRIFGPKTGDLESSLPRPY